MRECVVSDDESGSHPRPEAVVQDGGGALVHVSTWTVDCWVYTVPPAGSDTWYLGTVDWHQTGVGGRVSGLDGWMHGWVRLEEPCKADYDCGDMVGLYPPSTPFWCQSPSVCLATIDARLVNTPRLSPGCCPRRSVIQPCGRVQCERGVVQVGPAYL